MEQISQDWTVEQTLRTCPRAIRVFLHFRTDCVGCWLSRFCTLEEVSHKYHLDLEAFLNALQSEDVTIE